MILDQIPEFFDRIQFGTVRGQPNRMDMMGNHLMRGLRVKARAVPYHDILMFGVRALYWLKKDAGPFQIHARGL